MWALNYSINNLTLMALTLAIGFLVDDAIVFLENVVRRAEHGESIYRATLNSAGEISFTILSMTLSLAAVFIPLVFMPGLLGRIFPRVRDHDHRRHFRVRSDFADAHAADVRAASARTRVRAIAKTWMERFTNSFFQPVLRFYSRSLDWFLDHGWLAVPILIACGVGVWFFFSLVAFHPFAHRRQRRDSRLSSHAGRRLAATTAPDAGQARSDPPGESGGR